MRHIVTITLNPALDLSASVGSVVPGPKIYCSKPRIDPGGGGINVARAITELGGTARAIVTLGGETGQLLQRELVQQGIEVVPIDLDGLTRQSLAVVAEDTSLQYRFILPGPAWTDAVGVQLLDVVAGQIAPGALVVLSGSFPPGAPASLVHQMNDLARAHHANLVVDTSGRALKEAATPEKAPLFLLRMNRTEAEMLAGHSLAHPEDLARFGRVLLGAGVAEFLILSHGANGTVGVTAQESFCCSPPDVRPLSAVGAGDSLLAAVILKLAQGASFRAAVTYGTAAATSAVTTPATALCTAAATDEYLPLIHIRDL